METTKGIEMTTENNKPFITMTECECESPYRRGCSCNSMSAEPCGHCDWQMGHETEYCVYAICSECGDPTGDADRCECWEDIED